MAANPVQDWYSIGEVVDIIEMSASWIRETEVKHNIRPLQIGKSRTRYYSRAQLALLQRFAQSRGDSRT